MKSLPLYTELPQAAIAKVAAEDHDSECVACPHCAKARSVCMKPEGKAGGVLIVGEWPGRAEDQTGRPFSGPTARYVRTAVAKHWAGPVAYDYALRCAPGVAKNSVKDKHLDACRPFGARVISDVKPERIIALGPAAFYSILGRRPPQGSVRKGYGWYFDPEGRHVPVFLVMTPALILGNRFVAAQFADDMKHALTCELPTFQFLDARTRLVKSAADAKRAAIRILQDEWVVYDVETFGQMHNPDFRIEALTMLGATAQRSYTWTREALKDPACIRPLVRVLNSRPSVGQNVKYDDQSVMVALGARPPMNVADTRLLRKLDDASVRDARLETLAELVGMGGHKEDAQNATDAVCAELRRQARGQSYTPTGKLRKFDDPKFDVPTSVLDQIRNDIDPEWFQFGFVESTLLYRYNARDVWSTRAVYTKLIQTMTPESLVMWKESVQPANRAVRMIEFWGIPVDKQAVLQFERYCAGKLKEATARLSAYPDVNWDSPQQVANLLFKKLRLPAQKATKGGQASTDDSVLEKLANKHPVVDALRMHRKYSKLQGQYAHGMLRHIRADGRIHASYLLDGAETGRLSASDPNLQNIPRAKGSPDAQFARSCFAAPAGWKILELDFSQLELRIAALLSGDENMIADFVAGIDIHSNNARECCSTWGFTTAQWDAMDAEAQDPFRSQIKTTTFGRLYGKTLKNMARELDVSLEQIEAIDKRIWGRYKALDAWFKVRVKESRVTGVAWTWWNGHRGRCRPIPKIGSQEDGLRQHAERTAGNTPIQGTAAEFCTASLPMIVDWMEETGVDAELVGTVHDSVLVLVRDDTVDEAAYNVHRIMTSHNAEKVPIVVDIKVGQNWGSLQKYKLPQAA